jgi:hypothetical protein
MTATTSKCPSVTPVTRTDANGRPLREGICPECGGNLVILASGFFRTHKPVMKPGNPQIAINIANAKAKAGK